MAEWAVRHRSVSIALACRAFSISETCYRYQPTLRAENELIADWLVALTTAKRSWGFGLCFLHLRNVKGFGWNHKDAKRQLVKLDGQIANLVERIMDSSQPAVIAAYEKKISTLEQEKLVMKERIAKPQEEKTRKGTYYELALAFLSSPQRIWQEGNFAWKRIVLRLAFMEPIIYSREKGIRTPKTTLPFKALEVFDREKCCGTSCGVDPIG